VLEIVAFNAAARTAAIRMRSGQRALRWSGPPVAHVLAVKPDELGDHLIA
jgi:hypothetical protein